MRKRRPYYNEGSVVEDYKMFLYDLESLKENILDLKADSVEELQDKLNKLEKLNSYITSVKTLIADRLAQEVL